MPELKLEPTTPYMLRKDGTLLKCGTVHPYIKYYKDLDNDYNLNYLLKSHPEAIDWFIENTAEEETRNLLEEFKENPTTELLDKLSELTNDEFCKVRTSNYRYKYGGDNGEIYFRITPTEFNWFDNIWDTCIFFKDDGIKYVTVMKDYPTISDGFKYYKIKGEEINKMPVDDFLSHEGKIILEDLETIPVEVEEVKKEKSDEIADFIEELYDLRKQSIAQDGEYGLGNLVFKEFRNRGYLDNMKELRRVQKSKELSLEHLEESSGDELEQAKLNETDDHLFDLYKRYSGTEGEELNEGKLDEYALNAVSSIANYDVTELRDKLLNRSKK